jgi:hypothetical protein
MKIFHLPLPELVYEQLRAEALLAARKKAARKEEIAAYAVEMAGTEFDLNLELEAASSQLLFSPEPPKVRSRK